MEDILLAITVSAFFVFGFFAVKHIGRFIAEHFRPNPVPDMRAPFGDRSAARNSFPESDADSGKTLPPIL